mmetsp:Transcript_9786/g.17747  ORF Transcript_9786/g.17747 Transcript_9786/m.17747 type:complete len:210 (-) Transcript_9786:1283-1912(-)
MAHHEGKSRGSHRAYRRNRSWVCLSGKFRFHTGHNSRGLCHLHPPLVFLSLPTITCRETSRRNHRRLPDATRRQFHERSQNVTRNGILRSIHRKHCRTSQFGKRAHQGSKRIRKKDSGEEEGDLFPQHHLRLAYVVVVQFERHGRYQVDLCVERRGMSRGIQQAGANRGDDCKLRITQCCRIDSDAPNVGGVGIGNWGQEGTGQALGRG